MLVSPLLVSPLLDSPYVGLALVGHNLAGHWPLHGVTLVVLTAGGLTLIIGLTFVGLVLKLVLALRLKAQRPPLALLVLATSPQIAQTGTSCFNVQCAKQNCLQSTSF